MNYSERDPGRPCVDCGRREEISREITALEGETEIPF